MLALVLMRCLIVILGFRFGHVAAANLSVQTASGTVQGFQINHADGSVTNAWRGIPYANTPLRWERSYTHDSWEGVRNCTKFGSMCVQPNGEGSEDCLFLNVYNSADRETSAPGPVLFYIHGGSLMGGSGEDDMAGLVTALKNVVLVEINYRLNIFGYLAATELSALSADKTSGNYGFLDQILALQWVHDNIEGFGGDPTRVTIMGQSSGGTSVFALMSSPLSRGLFSSAISLSGSPNITMDLPAAHRQNQPVVAATGCQDANQSVAPEAVVACMRLIPPEELIKAIPQSWSTPGIWNLPSDPSGQHFAGLPVVDGIILAAPFEEALALGVVDVPLLFGNMAEEPDKGPEMNVQDWTQEQFKALLTDTFMPWGERVGDAMYALYYNDSTVNPQKAFDAIVSDYGLSCAAITVSRAALRESSLFASPLYVFLNDWALAKETVSEGSDYAVRYAYHELDLVAINENWQQVPGGVYVPDRSDIAMSKTLQRIVGEFVQSSGKNITGLRPVNDAASWPQSYNTYVISKSSVGMKTNFRKSICDYMDSVGLGGKEFWWVN